MSTRATRRQGGRSDLSDIRFDLLLFSGLASLALFASIALTFARPHLHSHNDRIRYALDRLPAALASVFVFTLIVALLRLVLPRIRLLDEKPSALYALALLLVFSVFWLPVVLASGFVQDDWILLAAASIRKTLSLHPLYSWFALDTVDGNFRPLGTVLYVGVLLKLFGLHPQALLAGNFVVNFLGTLLAFFIVRELGYSRIAGAAAAILYLSRGILYTENAWMSALGDSLVILFGALTVLLTLRAIRQPRGYALVYYVLGWACFCLATLAKQSSFAIPVIVALLLLLRPRAPARLPASFLDDAPLSLADLMNARPEPSVSLARRFGSAMLALFIYGATAGLVFLHARTLLHGHTPYPLTLSRQGFQNLSAYLAWYLAVLQPPASQAALKDLPAVIGIDLLIILAALFSRSVAAFGRPPRAIVFALLAALASLAVLIPLGTRIAPYYGAMFAFWISIALGILLTRFGTLSAQNTSARIACLIFCLLVLLGFLDVRLKQTALLPSGGYIWGTMGMDQERTRYQQLAAVLADSHAESPRTDTLVLVDFPAYPTYYASMALLADPALKRILTYDSHTQSYFANDLRGARPPDTFAALSDPAAYSWTTPLSPDAATQIQSKEHLLWIEFRDGEIERMPLDPYDDGSP